MGQYFIVANTTKKEYLHPHKFGSGLKFLEFTLDGFSVMSGVADDCEMGTGRWIGDHIVIVGDYDNSGIFDDAMSYYEDISNAVIQHMGKDPYVQQRLCERTRWEHGGKHPVFQNGATFMLPTLEKI